MQKLIFVVDDNDANLTMAALVLEAEYRVLTMPSAVKMLSLLEKKQPDMILLDIEMPDMTGFEAIAQLKERPEWQNIPVMFLTGRNEDSVMSEGLQLGALDFIHKPILPNALKNRVKNYLELVERRNT
ncbi:MAG: response regulator [Planctomycetaceae bacterium]|nr:response regulator [Planctomycetaceae bacterium]